MNKSAETYKLLKEIERLAEMPDTVDPLQQYRQWWDNQGIESEGEDGWPKDFCFEYKNIIAFADYWKGEE